MFEPKPDIDTLIIEAFPKFKKKSICKNNDGRILKFKAYGNRLVPEFSKLYPRFQAKYKGIYGVLQKYDETGELRDYTNTTDVRLVLLRLDVDKRHVIDFCKFLEEKDWIIQYL